jgi:hypothetical protein
VHNLWHGKRKVEDNKEKATAAESQQMFGMWVEYYKTPGEGSGAGKEKNLAKPEPRMAANHEVRLIDNSFRNSLSIRMHDFTANIDGLVAALRGGQILTLPLLFAFVRTLALNTDKGPAIYAAIHFLLYFCGYNIVDFWDVLVHGYYNCFWKAVNHSQIKSSVEKKIMQWNYKSGPWKSQEFGARNKEMKSHMRSILHASHPFVDEHWKEVCIRNDWVTAEETGFAQKKRFCRDFGLGEKLNHQGRKGMQSQVLEPST